MSVNLSFDGRWKGPKDMGTMTLGTAWADIGTAFQAGGINNITGFFDVTINDAANPRFRLVGQLTSGGSAYYLPIATVNESDVKVEDEYAELNVDSDQRQTILWQPFGAYPFLKLQASVESGTACTLNACSLVSSL